MAVALFELTTPSGSAKAQGLNQRCLVLVCAAQTFAAVFDAAPVVMPLRGERAVCN